jgi:hypothetical protein
VSFLARAGEAIWNFVVGDDWRIALGVAVAIALVAGLVQLGVNAWWLMPVAVLGLLGWSVRRAADPSR